MRSCSEENGRDVRCNGREVGLVMSDHVGSFHDEVVRTMGRRLGVTIPCVLE